MVEEDTGWLREGREASTLQKGAHGVNVFFKLAFELPMNKSASQEGSSLSWRMRGKRTNMHLLSVRYHLTAKPPHFPLLFRAHGFKIHRT